MPIYKINKKKDGQQGYRVRVSVQGADGKYRQIEKTIYGKGAAQSYFVNISKSKKLQHRE